MSQFSNFPPDFHEVLYCKIRKSVQIQKTSPFFGNSDVIYEEYQFY